MADVMKNLYKAELKKKIDAWEGKKAEDFQYEPERAQLKDMMLEWLKVKLEGVPEADIVKTNRKYFSTCMAQLVHEEIPQEIKDRFINYNISV